MKLYRLIGWAALLCFIIVAPVSAQTESDAAIIHVLNRLGYGPKPGDISHVKQVGIEGYIDEQLHPERIPLPQDLSAQLLVLSSTTASQRELITQFREINQAGNEDRQAERRELVRKIDLDAGEARLRQAIDSPRQLEERMVDFWFNHFNIFQGKGLDRVLAGNYEREAIRPYALGRFRDLLGATAHHPAMLFYLDNWQSTAAGFQPRKGLASGLNENYAREIMELHTLGVDGGYTQKDVTELARILTGWTINPRQTSGNSVFYFDARRHDQDNKVWLGQQFGEGGQAEGERVLDLLAASPATARHISYQLAQYFVSDDPPPTLVKRLTQRYLATDGDIRAMLKTLFDSPEFRDPAIYLVKFKTPYEYVVSSLRAANINFADVQPLLGALRQMGMPLYGCQTPDGYKNTQQAWLSPDAITRRINFATALSLGRLPKVTDDTVDPQQLLTTLGSSISAPTRAKVEQANFQLQSALVLGSPEFMHH